MTQYSSQKAIQLICISAMLLAVIIPAAQAIGGGQGWITVMCNVDGASVQFDNQYEGIISGGQLTVPVYTSGTPYSTVTVQLAGYTTFTGPVTMPAEGETTNIYATLNPIPTQPPVNYGSIYVDSAPAGAQIYFNGNYRGLSPLTISDVWPGSYTIEAEKDGYQPYSTTTTVTGGIRSNVYCTLARLDTSGALYVISDPTNSNVYLDAVYKGITPVMLNNIASGTHILQIDHAGDYDWKSTVEIPAGCTKTVSATLNPLPLSGTGWIYASSSPGGATVTLDGSPAGQTPVSGSIKLNAVTVGNHVVTLSLVGYQPYSQSVSVSPNTVSEVSAVLQSQAAPSGKGGLSISATPSGANVFLDNNFIGITPLTLNDITAGSHLVTIRLDGYQEYSVTTAVNTGATSTVSAALAPVTPTPRPASLTVLLIIAGLTLAGIAWVRKSR
jgi:PEGA domain